MARQERRGSLQAFTEARARTLQLDLLEQKDQLGLRDVRVERAPACDSWQVVLIAHDGFESVAATTADLDLIY